MVGEGAFAHKHLDALTGIDGVEVVSIASGGYWTDPPLGDRWWYPLYETMVELDVPAMIHVSAATACMLPGSTAHTLAQVPGGPEKLVSVEHPSGETSVMMNVRMEDGTLKVSRAAVLRTARKLYEGRVFPRSAA